MLGWSHGHGPKISWEGQPGLGVLALTAESTWARRFNSKIVSQPWKMAAVLEDPAQNRSVPLPLLVIPSSPVFIDVSEDVYRQLAYDIL